MEKKSRMIKRIAAAVIACAASLTMISSVCALEAGDEAGASETRAVSAECRGILPIHLTVGR